MNKDSLIIQKSQIDAIMVKRGLYRGGAAVYLKNGRVISLHWTEGEMLRRALNANTEKDGFISIES